MTLKITAYHGILTNKSFMFFLFSQGISSFGDGFHLIAVTSLLVAKTGSGLSAAFGLICYPILSILFSSFAGYACDSKKEKGLLVAIDLLRGAVVIMFMFKHNIIEIYVLIIMLSILDILYNPPRRKFAACIIGNDKVLVGNSILNGLAGGMFIIGPVLAGIVINKYGTDIAFSINSMSFFISAFVIKTIKLKPLNFNISGKIKIAARKVNKSFSEGFDYCLNTCLLRKIILIGTVVCFATTCVNIAFYPFAFDYLKISPKVWGIMISIFYGANMIAMPLTLLINFKMKTYYKVAIPIALLMISTIWFSYSSTNKIIHILVLQVFEGTILSFLSTILTSHLQMISKEYIVGRVIGINDFINNIGKIFGILLTYITLRFFSPNFVFLFCAVIATVSAFCICTFVNINRLETV